MSESGATRGIGVEGVQKDERDFEDYLIKHGLAFGINNYTQGWVRLSNATKDAKDITTVLNETYGFDVEFHENPDRQSLLGHISKYKDKLKKTIAYWNGPDDKNELQRKSLFVFVFSGHGHEDGFLIPSNGAFDNNTEWINFPDLCYRIKLLGYQHYMLFLDCCHSGVIATTRAGRIKLPMISVDQVQIVFREAAVVLTSGGPDDEVYDGERGGHSPFAKAVLQAFCDDLKSGYATLPQSIASTVQARVLTVTNGRVTPGYTDALPENLGGSREGRIVIFRKGFRITTNNLPQTALGLTYNKQLEAVDGTEPYVWSVVGLPQELTLNDTGTIVGMPKQAGSFTLHIEVKDTEGRVATRDLTLNVIPGGEGKPLKILTDVLEPGFVGQQYKMELICTGGVPPYRWTADRLPEGLELAASGECTAEIVGTPLRLGCTKVHISVTDSTGTMVEFPWHIPLPIISREDYCEVPAGRFKMGYHSSPTRNVQLSRLSNKYINFPRVEELAKLYPPCEIELSSFAIRKYPITNLDYLEYLQATDFKCALPITWNEEAENNYFPEGQENRPVAGISYQNAVDYCRWKGTRLPTAAEWEKAARGTDGRLYPWGDEFRKTSCNTAESKVGYTVPVGDVPGDKSPYGVYDMAGNVAEWVDSGMAFKIRANDGTYYGIQRHVRGASFRHPGILYGMCMIKSKESFATEILQPNNGAKLDFEIEKPQTDWIGFRDCVDLNITIVPEQKLINIRGGRVSREGRRPAEASSPFSIARFAVSNLEYLEFVLKTGHRRPAHWAQTNPPFPYEQRHWPVVNVSQADAQAFCRWKSEILKRRCRLPLAIHWELAAGGLEGRRYPWGKEFEAWRCNSLESGWGRPVNVFDLPQGATPEGVYNLCGNVFEWLLSSEDSRGGSWRWEQSCENAGTSWANTRNLNKFDGDTGFRYISESERGSV